MPTPLRRVHVRVHVLDWKQVSVPIPRPTREDPHAMGTQLQYRAVPKEVEDPKREAWFHGFFDSRDGEEAGPVAMVEYDDGTCDTLAPRLIQFQGNPA